MKILKVDSYEFRLMEKTKVIFVYGPNASYEIRPSNGVYTCNCPDSTYRRNVCKHMRMALPKILTCKSSHDLFHEWNEEALINQEITRKERREGKYTR